jgi:hypothetical protein
MVEKNENNIRRHDIDLILAVTQKSIELNTEVASQNEEIIETLEAIHKIQEDHTSKIDKIVTKSEDTNRDIFRVQVLFVVGLLGVVAQVIQAFARHT